MWPVQAIAQIGGGDPVDSGDTAWMLAASALVLVAALPGIVLNYAGRSDARNVFSISAQAATVMAAASLAWIVVGYTLAFGNVSNGWLGGGNAWMMIELGNVRQDTALPESAFALFQLCLAGFATALLVGTWAGRARFGWVVAFCTLWSLVIYAPIAHWLWGGGWLEQGVGTLDWAGGMVIHLSAGTSALVVAMMIGRRKAVEPEMLLPHNRMLALAGSGLIWIGSFGMVGGWALTANDDAAAAVIAVQASASAGALAWLLIERLTSGRPTILGFASGALAGLVAISPAAGYVSPGAAIVFGVLSSIACCFTGRFVKDRLGIDDTMNVFAVHGIGGLVGSLLLAIFLSDTLGGIGYGETMNMAAQTVSQLIGVGIVVIWSTIGSVILALMVSVLIPMRVSEESEIAGLDLSSHGERRA